MAMRKLVRIECKQEFVFEVPDGTTTEEGNVDELFDDFGDQIKGYLDSNGKYKWFAKDWRYIEVPIAN